MNQWFEDIKRFLWGLVIILSILFIIFVINQFVILYQFLYGLHPYLAIATVAIIGLSIVYVLYKLIIQLKRNPKVLELADNPTEEEYETYLDNMLMMLRKNSHITNLEIGREDLTKAETVQLAMSQLDELTTPIIKENANAIFLTTAISQNGSLDSLVVLFSITRMIWQIAKVYQTRPSLVSLAKLYMQVASVVLMARTIEDTDLIEYQLEPLITSIVGESVASAIPGMVPITNLVVSSLMEGAVNSFLTLRVGLITQDYLGNIQPIDKQNIRRSASIQSMKYMGSIINTNGKTIVKTVGKAVKKASIGTAKKWFNFGS
ncbi:DUF697 domain-containing protein [Aerococcaceae bacterium WGS1372]